MERDNRILAEMNSLARNLDVESKQPFTNLSDEEEYDVDRAEPMDDDEYFGGRDIISECSSYLHPPSLFLPLPTLPNQLYKPQEQLLVEKDPGISPRVNHNFLQDQLWVEKKLRSTFHHSCQKCEEYKEIIAAQNQETAKLKAQGNYISLFT